MRLFLARQAVGFMLILAGLALFSFVAFATLDNVRGWWRK